ncbi:sugar phosphate isomerase/epimerase [bacterium]|nr:sugar phosphate isomerase/epimerase [bacterium]
MKNPIILHVNYVEQGQSIPEMCKKAVEWGYDGIEFRRKRSKVDETSEQYLNSIAEAVQKTGLKHVLFGGPGANFMSADDKVREKETEECIIFFKMASERFKLTVCNTMAGPLSTKAEPSYKYDKQGSAIATPDQWKWAAEGFKTLGDLASELGFRFAFETHMNYIHDIPESAKKLVDMIDRESVGINLDYANIACFPKPVSLSETVNICANRLYYVHLKNIFRLRNTPYNSFIACGLGDGIVNNREFLRILKGKKYQGPVCVEAPRQGDRELFAKQDIAYIRRLLEELE